MLDHRLVLIGGIGCILGALIFHAASLQWSRWRIARRFRRGVRAEGRAEKILRRHGYRVTEVQQPLRLAMAIDGKRVFYSVRPDAVATRRHRCYLVEIKSGKVAPDPLYGETRRQLLEYYHSGSVDGVLLVDADRGSVKTIRFFGRNHMRQMSWWLVMVAFISGIFVMAMFVYLERV